MNWQTKRQRSCERFTRRPNTTIQDVGADFRKAIVATASGKKTPHRAPLCEQVDPLYDIKLVFVQKITFVLRKINKNCCHQSHTF